jgi:hypothetical protein
MTTSADPWMTAMRRGEFETAWQISDEVLAKRREQRVDCSRWPRHQQFIWDGSPLRDRHVLVRCYHGFGDSIQFVRLLEPLRGLAQEITLWVQPALLELMREVRGVDHLLALHDSAPDVAHDVDMELMEVAHALRVHEAQLPGRIPYLHVASTERTLDPRAFNVGLAWQSGDWNERRSIPTAMLRRLADVPNVRFHSLQFPLQALPFDADTMACADIYRMAQRMSHLDLVISVDTMVAHLAAALALPTWLLLNRDADWRWQVGRSDSPWYPTMRLFRQTSTPWAPVLEQAHAALVECSMRATAKLRTRSVGCRVSSS